MTSANADPYTKPLPVNQPVDEPYFAAALAGEFRIQQCSTCGTWRFPPSTICPKCLSSQYEWTAASGMGTIWSFIVMHQEYFPGFHDDIPYNVALIELDEGPLIMSNIVDCDNSDLSVGTRVEVTIDKVTPELALPKFRLA